MGTRGPRRKLEGRSIDPRTRRKLKDRNIDVELLQAMGPRKEVARGGEETNHDTLWYSEWKLGSKEIESQ